MNPHEWDSLTRMEEIDLIAHGRVPMDEEHLQVLLHHKRVREERRLIDECEHGESERDAGPDDCLSSLPGLTPGDRPQ